MTAPGPGRQSFAISGHGPAGTRTAATPRRQVLDIGSFDVHDVRAGSETAFAGGMLTIDVEELEERLADDAAFASVRVEIVRPGDSVRVINAIDAVEPRVKIEPAGADFSGMLTAPRQVGAGVTHALAGMAVVETALPVPGEPVYWREAIFDMAGTAAKYSPFSELINVVISCEPTRDLLDSAGRPHNLFEGTPEAVEYNKAVRLAGLEAARYLAGTTRGQQPDRVDTFDLAPLPHRDLPAVVYLYQLAIPYLHGEIAPGAGAIGGAAHLPTPIHPNELLDGALVCGWNAIACMRELTYTVQNHAIIEDLYVRHGQDLDFRGVVLFTNGDTRASKERLANHAAGLAIMMGAEGALINYAGGGHPAVDAMMIWGQSGAERGAHDDAVDGDGGQSGGIRVRPLCSGGGRHRQHGQLRGDGLLRRGGAGDRRGFPDRDRRRSGRRIRGAPGHRAGEHPPVRTYQHPGRGVLRR